MASPASSDDSIVILSELVAETPPRTDHEGTMTPSVEVESIPELDGVRMVNEPRTQTLVQPSPAAAPAGETRPAEAPAAVAAPAEAPTLSADFDLDLEDHEEERLQASTTALASPVDAAIARSASPSSPPPSAPSGPSLPLAKPMAILESRGGVLKASQTQMSTPIQIDQTQLPRMMKQPLVDAAGTGQAGSSASTITVQELEVTYQRNTFLNTLEVKYYKLLRSAFNQFLIFPKVASRAAVTAISRHPEHLKVAENVLSNTAVSFVICDVKLNIRAVVEIIDENQPPSNKDKARDYILKKAGLMVVRFYSGDALPDVGTLRKLLVD